MNDSLLRIDEINRKEIHRYLGYGKSTPEKMDERLIEEVLEQSLQACSPKHMLQRCLCKIDGMEIFLHKKEEPDKLLVHVESRHLADNLAQCGEVIMFACTLGVEADSLLRKYELTNMAKASISQACFAAMIEAYANKVQGDLKAKLEKEGLYLRPRFSPGYGDLKLETQIDFFKGMDVTKRLGITLTDSLLMFPTKSITAYIGLTRNPLSCHINKCKTCLNKGCEFRDEDC